MKKEGKDKEENRLIVGNTGPWQKRSYLCSLLFYLLAFYFWGGLLYVLVYQTDEW